MHGKQHNPASPDATRTVGLPSKAQLPGGPTPLIPDYHLIRAVGRGTFGTVWLAEETLASVFRAIKVLDPPAASDGAPRIDRELDGIHAYQAHAKDHPHLVRILKTGQCTLDEPQGEHSAGAHTRAPPASHSPAHQRRTVYYVMEIADHVGGAQPHHTLDYEPLTLTTLLRQKHRLPITHSAPAAPSPMRGGLFSTQRAAPAPAPQPASELATAHLPNGGVIDYALSLLDAIEHLYKAGLHHRDVKPSNCLFIGGILKLADVGLTTSDNREHIGTPAYMPPPDVADGPDGPDREANTPGTSPPEGAAPNDLYALGKVIYEMTTGLPAGDFPDWPADLDPTSDPRLPKLRRLINDLCHPSPDRRLTGLRDARRRLLAIARPTEQAHISRRHAVILASTAALLGLFTGGWMIKSWFDSLDPTKQTYGVSPYNGAEVGQTQTYQGKKYTIVRRHNPAQMYDVSSAESTIVRFFDLQSRLADGRLEVAGAYQIYGMTATAVTGDITINDGTINLICLIAGDGAESVFKMIFHGEVGRKPGICAPFMYGIPIEEIYTRPTHPRFTPIYLAWTAEYTLEEAEEKWHQGNRYGFHTLEIARLLELPPEIAAVGPNTEDQPLASQPRP